MIPLKTNVLIEEKQSEKGTAKGKVLAVGEDVEGISEGDMVVFDLMGSTQIPKNEERKSAGGIITATKIKQYLVEDINIKAKEQ